MIEENRVVTFMSKAGNRRADISYDDWRKEPYIVEFYDKQEWVGHTCWKTEAEAEKAAEKYTFADK